MNDCIDKVLHTDARAPLSTYRLQMHSKFTFADAQAILPYLKQLGIGDMYASPIFEARPGSQHGYDVTRHDRLNPELGGDEGFEKLSAALQEQGLGLLLDIVPNHMGIGNDSRWWQDVLLNGRASEYADYFDIDWKPLKADMEGKLLLPILGKQYGEALESKQIQVVIDNGVFHIQYFDHRMPVATRTTPLLFSEEQENLPQSLRDLLKDLSHIPPLDTTDASLAAQRRAQLAELRPRLQQALQSAEVLSLIARALDRINGVEGDAKSFDNLHTLLEEQAYRLAFWKVSSEEINYRRFFDVNDLVGLRMENPAVFADTHCLIRKLLAKHQVSGLRIDHADGMFNPREYLIRLQLLYIASQCAGESISGPASPAGIEEPVREKLRDYDWAKSQGPLYCVVEKILEPRESLPREWPVRGTSGYDFVHFANQIFIQPENERRFNELYASILGHSSDPAEIIYQSKLQVMRNALSSETYVLTNLLSQLAAADRKARDFTENILESIIRETIACFPVYRTYIDDRGQYTDRDRAFIRQSIRDAKKRNSEIDASAFDFLQAVLLLGTRKDDETGQRQLYFALKFQQLTGPVMAKGVEDTSFYVYTRFISSNEVGSSMKAFGITPQFFHDGNMERLKYSPDAMLTTSTHDTKRSEDVRNRLNVLSEMPQQWASVVRRWQRMNAKLKRTLEDGRIAPDPNEEYLIYQTIVGSWPWQTEDRENYTERIKQYLSKALSEAKINLSWINPNQEYMDAVHGFVTDILTPTTRGRESRFVETLKVFLAPLQVAGAVNSLSQLILKIASPGVPDFYQGTDLWDLSLVDPDNRRPVDYNLRTRYLAELQEQANTAGLKTTSDGVIATLPDGRIKLWTMHRALDARNRLREIFHRGEYIPLAIEGDKQQHAIAFLRSHSGKSVLTVVPRFAATLVHNRPQLPLGEFWANAFLILPEHAARGYINTFTGAQLAPDLQGRLKLRDIFAHYPVAMLEGE